MAQNSPGYTSSEVSVHDSPRPGPGPRPTPISLRNRPAMPRNAVMSREHPPLYAGDFNNNLSSDKYWWEKLSPDKPEEKRVLLAMYYGEERQPRCNVCELQNRACMWFLGEEDQANKSCVKCRRVHATCKTVGSTDVSIDESDDRIAIDLGEAAKRQIPDKRTRSSLRTDENKKSTCEDVEVISVKTLLPSNRHIRIRESAVMNSSVTPSRLGSELIDSDFSLDEKSRFGTRKDRPLVVDLDDPRDSSCTLGRDIRCSQEASDSQVQSHVQQSPSQDALPGLDQIKNGLYALIDQRHKTELESLKAQIVALRVDCTNKAPDAHDVDYGQQLKRMHIDLETERASRRRLEAENLRLKNRMARIEEGQETSMDDLQDQIRQLREDMNSRL
ncbi:hypothetical protein E4T38_09828 [Aureobasidium subglaciale]|nr:hypothetical protein E4T38_09828 [Aureobasidium subglaciale]KAI5213323.1 hypothetical protein E4T40_09826 [Aureobasidium subglaciale]KAI5214708.1 hypothetical protein E4T41_09822 [Aureobasidium subglaciale]KAI5252719.1 hypothetical protein E4T46_09815 [Aureobasidium subglaciale]